MKIKKVKIPCAPKILQKEWQRRVEINRRKETAPRGLARRAANKRKSRRVCGLLVLCMCVRASLSLSFSLSPSASLSLCLSFSIPSLSASQFRGFVVVLFGFQSNGRPAHLASLPPLPPPHHSVLERGALSENTCHPRGLPDSETTATTTTKRYYIHTRTFVRQPQLLLPITLTPSHRRPPHCRPSCGQPLTIHRRAFSEFPNNLILITN